jgi:hypothetical protein
MAQLPLDYKTYSAVLNRADIRKAVRGLPTREAALASLVREEPHNPAHAAAYARYTGHHPALVAKDTPSAGPRVPVVKQTPAPPPPPPSATDTLLGRIAKRQAEQPGLSFLDASNEVVDETPELHAAYVQERRHQPWLQSPSVAKQAPVSEETILKMAESRMAQRPGVSKLQALADLAQEHQGQREFWAAYREYQLGQGRLDYEQARLEALKAPRA